MAKNNKQQEKMSEEEMVKTVINESCDLANLITNHLAARPHVFNKGMTIICYAVEMMVRKSAEMGHTDFDELHREFATFLELVHEDVKKMMPIKKETPQAS